MSNHERRVDPPRQVLRCCEACGQPIDDWEHELELDGVRLAWNVVVYQGQCRRLKRGEAVLMRLLMIRGRLSKEAFLMAVNSDAFVSTANTYACLLRRALRELAVPLEIRTVPAWGYELRDDAGQLARLAA